MGGPLLTELVERGSQALEKRGLSELYDLTLKRSSRAIEDNIPGLGKLLTGSLKNFKEKFAQQYQGYIADADIPFYEKFKHDEDLMKNYYDYWTGAKTHPDPAVGQAIKAQKTARAAEYIKSAQAGIPVGPPTQDAWPRKWVRGSLEKGGRDKMIDHLINTGQVKSASEAKNILNIIGERTKGKKSYNLRVGRKYDLPGWRKDYFAVRDAMREGVYDRVFTETFGDNGAKLSSLLDTIRDKSGYHNFELANRYVDVVLRKHGEYYKPYSNRERFANSILAARYLGGISIRHAGQSLNAILFGGRIRPYIAAIAERFADPQSARMYGLRSGAVPVEAIDEIKKILEEEIIPEQRLGRGVFKVTGFPSVMRFNREITALYGRNLAEDLVDEYAKNKSSYTARRLAQLGIDADKAVQNGLTAEDLYRASSRTTEVTMSPLEHENLPIAWRDTELHRYLSQYRPFIYMQHQLIKNHVVNPALEFVQTGGKSGSLKPLAYLALVYPTAGELVGDAYTMLTKGTIKDRPKPKYWLDRYVDNIAWLGGLGALNDLIFAVSDPESFMGPLIGEIGDLANLITTKHKAKAAAKQIPIIGRYISSRMYPRRKYTPRGFEGYLSTGHLTKSLNKFLSGDPGAALKELTR